MVAVLAQVLISCGEHSVDAKQSQPAQQGPEVGVVKVVRKSLQRNLSVSSELVPSSRLTCTPKSPALSRSSMWITAHM